MCHFVNLSNSVWFILESQEIRYLLKSIYLYLLESNDKKVTMNIQLEINSRVLKSRHHAVRCDGFL